MATAGFSGLFDTIQPSGHTLLETEPLRKRVSKLFRNEGLRSFKELMITLNGVAAGSAALAQFARAATFSTPGSAPAGGGARTIDTVDAVNRVSATADQTAITAMLEEEFVPGSYPADPSGNGGGGQLDEQQTL